MNRLLLLLLPLFITVSCLDESILEIESEIESPDCTFLNPPDPNSIYSCNHENQWDESTIKENLLGKWHWKYIAYFWTPEADNNELHKGMTIEFFDNKVHNIFDGDTLISNYVIEQTLDGYRVKRDPSSQTTIGDILFCNDTLLFYATYRDVWDNYYLRENPTPRKIED